MRSSTLAYLRNELPMVAWAVRQHDRREQLRLEARILRSKVAEGLAMDVAWLLPRKVAYWATIRVGAEATTGRYGSTCPSELLYMDALKRFEPTPA